MATPGIYPPIFKGTVANGATQFVGVPVGDGNDVHLHISWPDATSSATITWEESGFDSVQAPVSAADATGELWEPNADVTITGPAGAAAGSSSVRVKEVTARRARLRILAAADTTLEIYCDVKRY